MKKAPWQISNLLRSLGAMRALLVDEKKKRMRALLDLADKTELCNRLQRIVREQDSENGRAIARCIAVNARVCELEKELHGATEELARAKRGLAEMAKELHCAKIDADYYCQNLKREVAHCAEVSDSVDSLRLLVTDLTGRVM